MSNSNAALVLINARSRQTMATKTELAMTRAARRRGLLHRSSLDPAGALVLAPCMSIHTAFMQFPIDVLFVDREGCVRRIILDMQPWRIAIARDAYAVIEFAAGALDSCDLRLGDRLYLEPRVGSDLDAASPALVFADVLRRLASSRTVAVGPRRVFGWT